MRQYHIFFLLFYFSSNLLSGQVTVEEERLQNIGESIGYYTDTSCNSQGDYKNFDFQKGESKVPLFEGSSCYWGKLELTNLSPEDKLVLELKANDCLVSAHVKQTLNYLAVSKLKLGLLINFGVSLLCQSSESEYA